jgi:hypothetical protein
MARPWDTIWNDHFSALPFQLSRIIEEVARCELVAEECGFKYMVYFNDPDAARGWNANVKSPYGWYEP